MVKKLKNMKSMKKWLLHEGEDYSKIFAKKADQCPMDDKQSPLCMCYKIKGTCFSDCIKHHTMPKDVGKKMNQFICNCCGESPS